MKNIELYEGFIKKQFRNISLINYKGIIKLYFKEYYVYIYTCIINDLKQGSGEAREMFYTSILDKLIFVNEIIHIKRKCYIDIDKNKFILNDLELDFDILPNVKFDIDDDSRLLLYFNRTKKEAIELYKYIDNKWNLDNIFKNKNTLTEEQRLELAKFINENIRDINYILDANNFDLI